MNNTVYVVGIGPGKEEGMTLEAARILSECETIIGYDVYLDLLPEKYHDKEFLSTPMRQEAERCKMAYIEALKGKKVCMISGGDAGIYGMASLMYEVGKEYPQIDLRVIPGVSAASSGAAILGAPINHDFCVISLSDALTPWEIIEKRLRMAARGDFAMVIYNPSSHKRKDHLKMACDILLEEINENTCCGYVRNIGRDGSSYKVCSLKGLREETVDMFTTVFIGNSHTGIADNKLLTPRGYRINNE